MQGIVEKVCFRKNRVEKDKHKVKPYEGSILKNLSRNRWLYIFLVPSIVYLLIFKYLPIMGNVIAFMDFDPYKGFFGSNWVGLKHFRNMFFESGDFVPALKNTLIISLLRILWGFPAPLILAILLNEIRVVWFKKTVQTIIYLPYFISWVVIAGMVYCFLSPSTGIVNELFKLMGKEPVALLQDKNWFRTILIISQLFKEAGYGTVIYLAALSGVNEELYEAASIDGAKRLGLIRYITFPAILPTAMVVLIINVGGVVRSGFEQVLLLYSPIVYDVADVIQTYTYRVGLQTGRFSYATAVGLFESLIAVILIFLTNRAAKKWGQGGLW